MSPVNSGKRPLEIDSVPDTKRIRLDPSDDSKNDDTAVPVKPAQVKPAQVKPAQVKPALVKPALAKPSSMFGPLLVRRLSERAHIPKRSNIYAAGFDLYRCVMNAQAQINMIVCIINFCLPQPCPSSNSMFVGLVMNGLRLDNPL